MRVFPLFHTIYVVIVAIAVVVAVKDSLNQRQPNLERWPPLQYATVIRYARLGLHTFGSTENCVAAIFY